MSDLRVANHYELTFEGKHYRCVIGSNGFTETPKEGGKATPTGKFALRECWYRADRIAAPETVLPLRVITPDDGWCDAPSHAEYNRHVKLPFAASHEELWRKDHIYDIVVPIGFNDAPIVPGRGSAIFFHLAKPDYSPTLGCVAVLIPDMLEILKKITLDTHIIIRPARDTGHLYYQKPKPIIGS